MSRPPLDDYFAYLDGQLTGERQARFTRYLAKNREAARRLHQIAQIEDALRDALIVDGLARSTTAPMTPRQEAGHAEVDETLIAAWVDGALTHDERRQLLARLQHSPAALHYLQEAQSAERLQKDLAANPSPSALSEEETGIPTNADQAHEAIRRAWLGRLLIQTTQSHPGILDAFPRDSRSPEIQVHGEMSQSVRLRFPGLSVMVGVEIVYQGAQLTLDWRPLSDGPQQWELVDEFETRLAQWEEGVRPLQLPRLQPGFYRLLAKPQPLVLAIGINGYLGTTEVQRLHDED